MLTAIIILSLIVIILIGFFISTYNKLVKSREMIANSRGQIAAQIESRWDALTNLIQATKEYSLHEAETLESVVNQRSALSSNADINEFNESEDMFQNSLSRIIAIGEAYPELRASEVYKQTMSSVDSYEKNVRLSRMAYNDAVTRYNRIVITIPTNIIASIANFSKEEYFESNIEKKDMPMWK